MYTRIIDESVRFEIFKGHADVIFSTNVRNLSFILKVTECASYKPTNVEALGNSRVQQPITVGCRVLEFKWTCDTSEEQKQSLSRVFGPSQLEIV